MNSLYTFKQTLTRELRLAFRNLTDILNPLWFFVIVISLFPLSITADRALLVMLAPGILWIAALLSILLSLDRLFRSDYEDGSLELMLLGSQPLTVIVFAKVCAFWLITVVPLLILSPVLALMLQLNPHVLGILIASLALGTATLCLLGAIGVALTLSLRQSGVILALLLLPLSVPILTFGAGSLITANAGLPTSGLLAILGALFVFTLTFAPWITVIALRAGMDPL